MHLWNQCGVVSLLLPYNLCCRFRLFLLKYEIPSFFFYLTPFYLVLVSNGEISTLFPLSSNKFLYFGLY